MKTKIYQTICILLLALSSTLLYGQQTLTFKSFDNVTNYAERMDSLKHFTNVLLGSDAKIPANYPLCLQTSLFALHITEPNDNANKASFTLSAGVAQYYLSKFDSAIYYFNEAVNYAKKSNNLLALSTSYTSLVALYMQFQQQGKADTLAIALAKISDTCRNSLILSKCYAGLGNYYYLKSYYATAQDYFHKNIELVKAFTDTAKDNRYKMELGVQHYMLYKIYANSELHEKAIAALKDGSKYMNASAVLSIRYNSAFVEAFTNDSVSNIQEAKKYYNSLIETPAISRKSSEYVMSNISMAQYYTVHGQFNEARPYLNKAIEFANESQSAFLIHQVQNMEGILKFHEGNYTAAIPLFEGALPFYKKISMSNYLECLYRLGICYQKTNQAKKAMDLMEEYIREKDAYTRANMNRHFADFEVRYKVLQQQDEIKELSAENKLKQLKIQNASRDRMYLLIGIVGISIILLLLFWNYRNKTKLNKTLSERNNVLDVANEKLALANETKTKLFGIFSHDLRSPISKIAQYLRIQQEYPGLMDEKTKTEFNTNLRNATSNLLETMEDLLFWSKGQMERFQPDPRPTKVHLLIDNEIKLVGNRLDELAINIQNNTRRDFEPVVDDNFLRIIVRNLLSNALKYGKSNSSIVVETKDKRLYITNVQNNIVRAEELNLHLKQPTINSSTGGLGLQITNDLASRIGIKLHFESFEKSSVTAVLEFA